MPRRATRGMFGAGVAGLVVGGAYSLMLLYMSIVSGGAGDGSTLPFLATGGALGTGYFLWPLIAAAAAISHLDVARLLGYVLMFINYVGGVAGVVMEWDSRRYFEGWSMMAWITAGLFVGGQVVLWYLLWRSPAEQRVAIGRRPGAST